MRIRGIALFGPPGSGKTALAQALKKRWRLGPHLEASREVIAPALAADGRPFTRENARRMFSALARRHGPDFIAAELIRIHRGKRPGGTAILAGVRGFHNAERLKRAGYLVAFLSTADTVAATRLAKRDGVSKRRAVEEIRAEEHRYATGKIRKIADIVLDAGAADPSSLAREVMRMVRPLSCRRCLNDETNPTVRIDRGGLCSACADFKRRFDPKRLSRERRFLVSLAKRGAAAMVGFSGGKDSTATLIETRRLGFTPTAFTFDLGHYPPNVFKRAARIAKRLGFLHERIDIMSYIRPVDRRCYRMMADLYDEPETPELAAKFRKLYAEGRKHYSAKCRHALPFVRTCQLCRRVVIRAYYGEALRRGAHIVILGMNEWAGLSGGKFGAIRKLKPYKNKPAVYVVHLPFLFQRKLADTRRTLASIGWKLPSGERLVESNANSCLLAQATEAKAARLLGFHPDTTRLSREITAGFMKKGPARKALAKTHRARRTVRQVLREAGIL